MVGLAYSDRILARQALVHHHPVAANGLDTADADMVLLQGGMTALHYAVNNGQEAVIDMLLKAYADKDAEDFVRSLFVLLC